MKEESRGDSEAGDTRAATAIALALDALAFELIGRGASTRMARRVKSGATVRQNRRKFL